MLWRVALLTLAALVLTAGKPRRFDSHTVYRVLPTKELHVQFLNEFADNHLHDILFWEDANVTNKSADVMVTPRMQSSFVKALKEKSITYSVFIEDVQKLIDKQIPDDVSMGPFSWDAYHTLHDVHAWLRSLPATYPGIVTTVRAGFSFERLEILGVKISYGAGRPIAVIEGTIHAREWISTASVTWFINEILSSTDARVRSIVDQFDFYIFPVTNPDGYEYSWTDDRMWRKTRRPHVPCFGTDGNRNWDHRWSEEGASSDQCREDYAGPMAFSECETKAMSEFLTSLGSDLQVYLSFHNYRQLLIYPYGSSHEVADNAAELHKMAEKAVKALESRYGTHYGFGSVADAIYPATGGSIDWVKGKLGVPYVFLWELRDKGHYGFLLPPDQIIPTSEETFYSVLSILEDVWDAIRC
ncbi:zinc carboxypeptidase-like [Schistocerca nitens]|uniref:zinc carboxypeptidase-like n=1 Tax=Schistocerca nitens TaxID=7011 RepID=UPI002118327A|nr:zinc carboxypeptidase-like [Schistocerca nitens]